MNWQPIETAPMDWSHVLVYDCESAQVAEAYYRQCEDECGWYLAGGGPSDEGSKLIEPTHWMPLPPAPEATTPHE
jgi:hypothetical protein